MRMVFRPIETDRTSMRWEQLEFVLKGVYLGLVLVIAQQEPEWYALGLIALITLGTLGACLGVAAIRKLREGYRVRGRLFGFILFLILENPTLVYAGVIVGLWLGAYVVLDFHNQAESWTDMAPILGGAVLGLVFWNVRQWQDRRWRFWGSLLVAVLLVAGSMSWLDRNPDFSTPSGRAMLGYLLLLSIPGFYLLTFAGVVEESEIEIGAICAALGVGLYILATVFHEYLEKFSPNAHYLLQIIPLALYFVYTRRILPELRVFKHVLRGMSYAKVGRHRLAILALNRALQLDSHNRLAREQLWHVYEDMDFDKLARDPETLAVVNFDLCLERAAWLLLQTPPHPEQVQEALRLIDLIATQRPVLTAPCQYWRAVGLLHQKRYEAAAESLTSVLAVPDLGTFERRGILVPAWELALIIHPEMIKRVGNIMVAQPDRRMEAIAAVERHLAAEPEDQAAWDLKRILYADLTEADYQAWAGAEKPAADFDHDYVLQIGDALVKDKERWQRGCEYLRVAARGLPRQAPAIYLLIGKAHEQAGDPEGQRNAAHRAKNIARAVGPQNLSPEHRESVFAAVKWLGDIAMAKGPIEEAMDCFHFYTLYDKAGLETYRTLAELYERRAQTWPAEQAAKKEADLWIALHCTEHALTYDARDRDVLERKDRYYYSVTPAELKRRLEDVYKWFDTDYCKQKVRSILEQNSTNPDTLDWAEHLAGLAQTADASSHAARLLRARIKRQRGELDESRALLEEIRQNKPEKFANSEEEEAWYIANRLLGEMYVDNKPDQAVICLNEYKRHPKSGANTLFHLGRAYENLGDRTRAAKCYEMVAAYEGNPLVWEAQDALQRLRGDRTDVMS
jgi:hypothetical protein